MRMIGNEVHIQRGETWALDFEVVNEKGHPYTLLKTWQNPYLVITVTAALYEQEGDFRESYWLDLNQRFVEQPDGSISLETAKKFISNEVLWLSKFDIDEAISSYGVANGGNMVLNPTSDFDITNYLFFVDENFDGNYVYKYVERYSLVDGKATEEVWKDYNFRIIKTFNTKDWMEQSYLYDAKILTGQSLEEAIAGQLAVEEVEYKDINTWSDEDIQNYINLITNEELKSSLQKLFDDGTPLNSDYDTKLLIIEPTRLYVSVNIQGGVGN